MKRKIAVSIASVALFLSGIVVTQAGAATGRVSASGGKLNFSATVRNAKTCSWSSSPKIAEFTKTVKCKTGTVSRSAKFAPNTSTATKKYTMTLTVRGRTTTTKRWMVTQAGMAPITTTTVPATTTTTTTTAPNGPVTTFGSGTYIVGTGIAAGTYHAPGGSGCYWARLSGFGGTLAEIISNDVANGPTIVSIATSDAGFQSSGCGTWSPLPASGPQSTSFGDGQFAVGIDIAAGTYSAPGGGSCYWERQSGFGGTISEVIANDLPTGPVIVAIQPSDVGFKVQGCGTWTRQ